MSNHRRLLHVLLRPAPTLSLRWRMVSVGSEKGEMTGERYPVS